MAPRKSWSTGKKGTVKRSVTFSADVDARAHALVGERGFSAFVNEAARAALQFAATDSLIAEYEAKHGAITESEMQQARRTLEKSRSKKRTRAS